MHDTHSILIVDDDVSFCSAVAEILDSAGGFKSEAINTIQDAERAVFDNRSEHSAILLDISLPDGDGRELCAKLRQHGSTIPVIMMSGLDQEADVVQALDLGADAYMHKPIASSELIARLRHLLPRPIAARDGAAS